MEIIFDVVVSSLPAHGQAHPTTMNLLLTASLAGAGAALPANKASPAPGSGRMEFWDKSNERRASGQRSEARGGSGWPAGTRPSPRLVTNQRDHHTLQIRRWMLHGLLLRHVLVPHLLDNRPQIAPGEAGLRPCGMRAYIARSLIDHNFQCGRFLARAAVKRVCHSPRIASKFEAATVPSPSFFCRQRAERNVVYPRRFRHSASATIADAVLTVHGRSSALRYNATRRNRSALLTTDTELKLIASAATIGESIQPSQGYSAPAASGTPMPL